jgi:NAD(P)-dependent dehydrogenase (short-subunit alcohol dehydrogenase family)
MRCLSLDVVGCYSDNFRYRRLLVSPNTVGAGSMLDAGGGVIVNMASQAASVALEAHVACCASKFGVVGVSKVLAAEWGPRGVRVDTISPTVVLTELGRMAWDGPHGEALKKLIPRDGSPTRARSPRPQCIWAPTPPRWSPAPTWSATGLHHQVVTDHDSRLSVPEYGH